jgi:glycosyltransferase involved in cell wall biosynthesis
LRLYNAYKRSNLATLHIGLNLIYLVPGETGGMETYARELIPALRSEEPDLRLTAFINRELYVAGDGPWTELADPVVVPVRARRRVDWVRGEQQLLPRLAADAGVDVLHSLGGTAPLRGPTKRVVTIHDLIYKVYPEAHFGIRSLGMRMLVPRAARHSHRIIAPSQSTKDDLLRLLDVEAGKIDVVALGVAAPAPAADLAEVRQRYELGDGPVVLTTSAMRPHKNLLRLLDAWALIPEKLRGVLMLPGYSTPYEQELRRHAETLGVAASTRFPGWVSTADLEALYRLAQCFVFPSLYEGFGLPVLEAMARGIPVACSGRASLAEIVDGAARLFDPESPQAIADAIEEILSSAALADRLRQAGRERARHFTWSAAARGTLGAYERALAA